MRGEIWARNLTGNGERREEGTQESGLALCIREWPNEAGLALRPNIIIKRRVKFDPSEACVISSWCVVSSLEGRTLIVLKYVPHTVLL